VQVRIALKGLAGVCDNKFLQMSKVAGQCKSTQVAAAGGS
jgi:hypothetical protein